MLKAIRKVLFIDLDDRSVGPIFKAMLRKKVLHDPVLSTAGVEVRSAGIHVREGRQAEGYVVSTLHSLGIHDIHYLSQSIFLHRELIQWADLILVVDAFDDIVSHRLDGAWGKTMRVDFWPHWPLMGRIKRFPTKIDSEEACLSYVEFLENTMPDIIAGIKDSYIGALVCRGTTITPGCVAGSAFVARSLADLEGFVEGNIVVMDVMGAALPIGGNGIEQTVAANIVKKFIKGTKPLNPSLERMLTGTAESPSLASARQIILARANGAIFSHGGHGGERTARIFVQEGIIELSCISRCIGATESIAPGQVIVLDGGRGEVYDASLLSQNEQSNNTPLEVLDALWGEE